MPRWADVSRYRRVVHEAGPNRAPGGTRRSMLLGSVRLLLLLGLLGLLGLLAGCTERSSPLPSSASVRDSGSQASPTRPPGGPAQTSSSGLSTSPGSRTSSPSAPRRHDERLRIAPVRPGPEQPHQPRPANPPAVGSGANPRIEPVPTAVWASMVGYSWSPGCPVGRPDLRYLSVNFWGWDGARSRGHLVLATKVAAPAASAFTRLYAMHFRIRQMRVMDSAFGHEPVGPGADDYVAMNADDTSAFNCRHIGGQEANRQWSLHAYGSAIDINDFENPYVDSSGVVYPDSWFTAHRSPYPGLFTGSTDPAVTAFTSLGFSWGGTWTHPDFQHFQMSR